MAKVALIGAGSVEFTKRLVNDILFFDSLKNALNASLKICSLKDANKMEDRNQVFLITSSFAAGSRGQ